MGERATRLGLRTRKGQSTPLGPTSQDVASATLGQRAFVTGGLQSLEAARSSGVYVAADGLVNELQRKLDAARARLVRLQSD